MRRGRVKALGETVWFKPMAEDSLEVAIVPAFAGLALPGYVGGDPEVAARRVCERAFVDFRGYLEDDGTEVPNTHAVRVEIYRILGDVIAAKLMELNREALLGEGSAVSG